MQTSDEEAYAPDTRLLGGESDGLSRQLARYIASAWRRNIFPRPGFGPLLVFRHDRYLRGGDHFAFNEQVDLRPCVLLTEYPRELKQSSTPERWYEPRTGIEYGDLPKFVDYEYTANVARLNAATR